MNGIKQSILKAYRRLRGKFPELLPTTGAPEFEEFASKIFRDYDLPDMPSYRHAIASMIMHLGPLSSHASKSYFARSVRKAMANQVAFDAIQKIKADEDEKRKAAEEVTSPTKELLDGETPQ